MGELSAFDPSRGFTRRDHRGPIPDNTLLLDRSVTLNPERSSTNASHLDSYELPATDIYSHPELTGAHWGIVRLIGLPDYGRVKVTC